MHHMKLPRFRHSFRMLTEINAHALIVAFTGPILSTTVISLARFSYLLFLLHRVCSYIKYPYLKQTLSLSLSHPPRKLDQVLFDYDIVPFCITTLHTMTQFHHISNHFTILANVKRRIQVTQQCGTKWRNFRTNCKMCNKHVTMNFWNDNFWSTPLKTLYSATKKRSELCASFCPLLRLHFNQIFRQQTLSRKWNFGGGAFILFEHIH